MQQQVNDLSPLIKKMIHYFAYGSNLHPVRLTERVPSANLLGVVELCNHQVKFHKKSNDGSSKCNLIKSELESDSIHGAIYKLNPVHKPLLDGFEGKGSGYIDEKIKLQLKGKEYSCFTYIAQHPHIVDNLQPYHWYKELVVLGAGFLQFPEPYISSIKSIASVQDPDPGRRKINDILIDKMVNFL